MVILKQTDRQAERHTEREKESKCEKEREGEKQTAALLFSSSSSVFSQKTGWIIETELQLSKLKTSTHLIHI